HDFINKLPLRYETHLEENAANLSGGQKQRLAIARAILKKPDIFIMDEATSNLDSISEKAIERTIETVCKGVTTIIIAHRLSTIKRCDRIYVMDDGKIIEMGTHKELMDRRGRYYELWKEQLPDNEDNKEKMQLITEEESTSVSNVESTTAPFLAVPGLYIPELSSCRAETAAATDSTEGGSK
ncbi:MAG: ATP-binding cassette domain-containing protein, partial [Acetivibrionales bacterium]